MMVIKELDAKQYFGILLLLLLLTNIVILLNIPFLRQILGFLCFTLIPGLLLLQILKLNKLGVTEKIVLAVGLSVAFLMFAGAFINNVYYALGYKTPLSSYSLTISFSIILLLLLFFAYKRNENNFVIPNLNLKNYTKEKMFLITLTFPFLSIFGAYLMNSTNNNMATVFTLLLISIYVILVTISNKKVPNWVYPIAIWTISISLLFMVALRYNYLIGGSDTIIEYRNSLFSLKNLYWSLSTPCDATNTCLSVGVLPTVYQSLLNIGLFNVYKIIFMILISFVPLTLYVLFSKYLTNTGAFLSSLFFAFQFGFIYFLNNTRTAIAILFFSLFVMTFFSEINELAKKILLIIFMASVIVSHYTTTYISFIMFFILFLMIIVTKNIKTLKVEKSLSTIIIFLFFALIFFWNSQVTEIPFTAGVDFLKDTFKTMSEIFIAESRAAGLQRAMGENIRSIPDFVNIIIYYISFIFVGLGAIYSLINHKKSKFEVVYLLLMSISLIILILMILVPHISVGYGITRTYQQMLVLLAPFFVVGGSVTFKFLKSKHVMLIILTVLITTLLCSVGGVYQVFGDPHSIIFNSQGYQYDTSSIHEQDIVAGNWLKDTMVKPGRVCTDVHGGGPRGPLAVSGLYGHNILCKHNKTSYEEKLCSQYIFLRHLNVVNKKVTVTWGKSEGGERNIADYSYIFMGKSKIYANGGSEIWN